MPKNRKDEKLESSRVEVSLELLLKGAKKGYTIDELVGRLDPWPIAENINKLLDAGANPDKLMSRLCNEDVTYCLETRRLFELLVFHRLNPDQLVSQLTPRSIVESLNELLMFHAKIDVDKLVSRLDSIDVDKLVSRLDSAEVARYLDKLLAAGAKIDVDELVGRLDPWPIAENMNKLLDAGANPDKLMSRLYMEDVTYCLETRRLVGLLRYGVDPDQLVSQLTPWSIVENLEELLMFHAKIDVDKLVSRLDSAEVARYLDKLLAALTLTSWCLASTARKSPATWTSSWPLAPRLMLMSWLAGWSRGRSPAIWTSSWPLAPRLMLMSWLAGWSRGRLCATWTGSGLPGLTQSCCGHSRPLTVGCKSCWGGGCTYCHPSKARFCTRNTF